MKKIIDLFSKFKDLTSIGFANVLSAAILGVYWIYLASLLEIESYGEVSYLIAIAGIVSIASLLGAPTTMLVYTSKEIKIQSTLFFLTLISGGLTSIVLFLIFFNIGMSVYVIGSIAFSLTINELLGRKLFQRYSKYMIIQRLLLVVLSIGLYYLIGIEGIILGYGLSYTPYLKIAFTQLRNSKINFSLLKPRYKFMTNNYMIDLSRVLSFSTDKLIIAPLFGFAFLGNYQFGVQILTLLIMVPTIVYQYVLPHDARGNPNKKLKVLTVIISAGLAILTIIIAPLIIPVTLPKFNESIEIIQILSIALVPRAISLMYISKFLGTEHSKIVITSSGLYLLVQVVSIILLGELFGIIGVASSLILAASSESIFLFLVHRIGLLNFRK